MIDILERLHDNQLWLHRDGFRTSADNARDAAGEITRLRQQVATLTEQRDIAVEALFIASETFREYASIHAAKAPPDLKKAEFNGFRAQQMIDALKDIKSSEVK
jgi:hypothetical protein